MDIEGPAPADLPGPCISGMAQGENRVPKCDKKQVIRNTEEETRLQEEKVENAEDSKQSPNIQKRLN
jgi:hypothetical protein